MGQELLGGSGSPRSRRAVGVGRSRPAPGLAALRPAPLGLQLVGPAWTERTRPPAGYSTRKQAEDALRAFLTDAQRGELPDPGQSSGKTFGDAVAEWLRYTEVERQRAESTVRDYRNVANGALLPEFGEDTPLDAIDQDRLDAYRQRLLTEAKVSRRTIQKTMVLLHGIFKRARQLLWIRENPAENVERVQLKRSGDFNVLSVEQVEAVARAAEDGADAAIIVAAYTGLRTGELRALRWRDVDFATATLHVRRNRPAGGSERAPKSGQVRSVPLMDDAARELDRLSRRERFTAPDDYVFCSEVGDGLKEDVLRQGLYTALEAAGIDRKAFPARGGFTFHDLRHTYGTLAVQVYPLVDVQAYMGHADIQTTMAYAHHVPKHNAADALTEFVRAQRSEDPAVPEPTAA
jgi:integrase